MHLKNFQPISVPEKVQEFSKIQVKHYFRLKSQLSKIQSRLPFQSPIYRGPSQQDPLSLQPPTHYRAKHLKAQQRYHPLQKPIISVPLNCSRHPPDHTYTTPRDYIDLPNVNFTVSLLQPKTTVNLATHSQRDQPLTVRPPNRRYELRR